MIHRYHKQPNQLFLAAVFLFFVALPALAQKGWTASKVGAPGQDLTSVYFLDEKRGWVGGDSGFLSRTDDGGRTWTKQSVETTDGINDIYFRDKESGFLLAGNAIFATRDNGARWTEARRFTAREFDGADVELYSVRFSSKKKGWVVGSVSKHQNKRDIVVDSILLFTENGGETWQRQRAPSRLELIHIDFDNDKRGWIVGTGGTILATVDAGQTWTRQESKVTGTIYHVDFRSEKKGLAVGDKGTILRTTDGGLNWIAVEVTKRSTLLNVQFVNDREGWAVGRSGTILRTDDGGATWLEQESGTKVHLYGLIFVKKVGWAVGGDGTLLRYEQ